MSIRSRAERLLPAMARLASAALAAVATLAASAALAAVAALVVSAVQPSPARAQDAPKREVRAVWLTTLSGLDWPAAADRGSAVRQRESLSAIIANCARLNLNTVLFQVRSRGNAFCVSPIEPWAAELGGALGRDPGWDPLAEAIDLCHARGMQLHAWVNVFRVWTGGGPPPRTQPLHVMLAHPDWVRKYGGDWWIDPGIPAARQYVIDVIVDLAQRYDLDGVHLDYARYPEADFDDANTWKRYGDGGNRAAWRRGNVDALVRDLSRALALVKPRLLLGAAPIGIYRNIPGAHGWQGYEALGQDSRRWLREGWMDYLSPQMYWGLTSRGSSIDTEALIDDWTANASGRQIYAGLAPYKPEILASLGELIDASRARSADGQVHFRYAFVADDAAFQHRYAAPAIPPPLPWKDGTRPNPPRSVRNAAAAPGTSIAWDPAIPAADGELPCRYVVYRGTATAVDVEAGSAIVAVLPSSAVSFLDPGAPFGAQYAVTALDRCFNESAPALSASLAARLLAAPSVTAVAAQISEPVTAGNGILLLSYRVARAGPVRIRLLNESGSEAMIIVDEWKEPGLYTVGIEEDRLPETIARYVYESGSVRAVKPFAPPDEP